MAVEDDVLALQAAVQGRLQVLELASWQPRLAKALDPGVEMISLVTGCRVRVVPVDEAAARASCEFEAVS